ncbi:helix-turn-helix transcriptional regulator [Sansalvadorimonas sp. 2012CJ34-2]|uniref:Helix-turn-helix transcriptional regulator n=1 Tax=Parendozoicomonas callyspongiae TaxID=2942213 RepID=A0ABT0PDK6_9GAMM|nr:helix-turn-helix transcriptional regulator [Sansalvadorimonas sp. 2012CJ34-2]MCL6268633.1 helix-turn-helix transcriptional regulator [Sansalvadorimonas sp. 2012CJ34-2]
MTLSTSGGRVVLSSQLTQEKKGQEAEDIFTHSARSLEVIKQEIQDFISGYGFLSFRYSSAPKQLSLQDHTLLQNFNFQERADGREGFGTLPEKLLKTYYRSFAGQDSLWPQLEKADEPVIHLSTENCSSKVLTFFHNYNINSQLFLPMRWQTGSDWFCIFSFQSSLSPEDLKEHYETIHTKLNARALGWHLELMAFKQDKFNPYIVRKVLSPRARHILKLAAEGYSSRTIAEMTDISDNGVNYHYREAKRVLGARNRTHLVSLAKDLRLI